MPCALKELAPGAVVVIATFDDIPQHRFLVQEVFADCVTGIALTGPLAGAYGEPERDQIIAILPPGSTSTE
jgi:hypothetical protein